MHAKVTVFVLPPPRSPTAPPTAGVGLEVEATSHGGLRAAALAQLGARGDRVRSLSFTPTGLVAYVEASA